MLASIPSFVASAQQDVLRHQSSRVALQLMSQSGVRNVGTALFYAPLSLHFLFLVQQQSHNQPSSRHFICLRCFQGHTFGDEA